MAKKRTEEDKNIESIERRYLYEQRQRLYIANEEVNQVWDETDIPDFIKAWNNNWSLSEIAEYLGADQHEIQLLAADLIKQGKIQGNIHIFKPKRRERVNMESIKMGDAIIRSTIKDKEAWVCLKDVWNWIRKPDHTYRKVTESWGPDQRAKFPIITDGGQQKMIFVNAAGVDRLTKNMDPWQRAKMDLLKAKIVAASIQAKKRPKRSTKGAG